MGMDLDIRTDKEDQIKSGDYLEKYFNDHSLSRTFCNMMTREDVIEGESEFFQIGRITGVDVSPIYQMAYYINEDLEFLLDGTETMEERRRIEFTESPPKGSLKGNIDRVIQTLGELLAKIEPISNLPELLNDYGYDTLNNKSYFADFSVDKGDGYIGNNFGQDLRNFLKAVNYAKQHGATTVYFGFD